MRLATNVGARVAGLVAVAGLAALAGCGGPTAPAPSQPSGPAPSQPTAPNTPGQPAMPPGGNAAPCRTVQLSARLDPPGPDTDGARTVPLVYTNTSGQACTLRGAPTVELHGPDDPNGPLFEMSARDSGTTTVVLAPGASATAPILVRADTDGRTGHGGSVDWTPTELVSIPPGETSSLRTRWTAGGTVLREDSSTHPDEYVEPFRPR
jgi:hypothetical protein